MRKYLLVSTGLALAFAAPAHAEKWFLVGESDDGLAVYEDGAWRHYAFDPRTAAQGSGLAGPSIEMIVATPGDSGERTLWIGSGNGELSRVRALPGGGYAFERIPTPWPKATGEGLRDTLVRRVDGRDEQWVATRQSGVWRLRDGRWTAFRPAKATGQWGAGRLLEQRDGSGRSWLWANSNQGLARFDGERWDLFGREAGLPDDVLIGLHLLPDAGTDVMVGEKVVGQVTTSARHHELGPIALALVKRSLPLDAQVTIEGVDAAQEAVVSP